MPQNSPLLVIGGSGFIGAHIIVAAWNAGYTVAYTYAKNRLALQLETSNAYQVDLDQSDYALENCIAACQPQTVIYCAVPPFVYTDGPDLHQKISVEGVTRTLAALESSAPNALFVYISTNVVFGGGRGLYRENETPDPELRYDPYRTYGLTKAAGEEIALERWPNTLIARTCVVYGRTIESALYPRIAGLVESLQSGQPLRRFHDRYISPTLVDNFVEALLETISPSFSYRGILHLCGSERVSDYQYAFYLARRLKIDPNLVIAESLADSPTMSSSPGDNSLSVSFTQSLLQTPLLNVEDQLTRLFPD